MNISLYLARRLSPTRGDRKGSPAIKVSVAAVALSIAVMIASIAIVTGFKREIREKVGGFNSDITLYVAPTDMENSDNLVTLTPSLAKFLDDRDFISEYSLDLSIPAIFKTQGDFKGIYIRSLNDAKTSRFLKRHLEEGSVPDYQQEADRNKIVISRIAARELGLKAGDKIDTYFISDDIKVRRLEIAGIFNTHFDSYDKVLAYGDLRLLQNLTGLGEAQGTSVHIQTTDENRINEYTSLLGEELVKATASGQLFLDYRLENALHQGAAYYNWLSLLDTNVIVVLILMTIVAIATLISGMLILILDKKHFIGIVRAMGAPTGDVRKVFVYLAMKIAFYGMLIGNAVMIALLWCQAKWHVLPLDADAYYIDFVPVDLNWTLIVILNVASFIVIYLSLILPSRYVARISPAEAMRTGE